MRFSLYVESMHIENCITLNMAYKRWFSFISFPRSFSNIWINPTWEILTTFDYLNVMVRWHTSVALVRTIDDRLVIDNACVMLRNLLNFKQHDFIKQRCSFRGLLSGRWTVFPDRLSMSKANALLPNSMLNYSRRRNTPW